MTFESYVEWKISDALKIKDKYGYRVTLIYADGTKKVQQKSGFKSERECKKARDATVAKLYNGNYIVNEDITLKDFLECWINDVVVKMKASTYRSFTRMVHYYIDPKIGNIKLAELTKGHLTAFYAEICNHSYDAAKRCRVVLKLSLRYAVSKKLIPESPAENLLLPKQDKKKTEYHTITIKPEQTLTAEQLKLLIEKSKDTPIYLFVLFAGLMGMRKSEIIGLKYSDIDYAKQTITVQRQLGEEIVVDSQTGEHKILKKQEITTKTKSSTRVLDIPDVVFNAIIEERKKYEANRRRRSTTFQDLDFIVCSSYGRPRSSCYVSPHYKKLLRENGLPDIRFHDLRHTFATLLLKKDIDLKAISNALGHSKSIISVDVYGDNQQIIADGVEEIIPFIREIMPEDVLAYLEEGQEKQRENFEPDICFPNALADDIMQDVMNNRASCGKDN